VAFPSKSFQLPARHSGNAANRYPLIGLIGPDEDDSRAGRVAYDVFFTTVANQ
jgi:hypothetical protein